MSQIEEVLERAARTPHATVWLVAGTRAGVRCAGRPLATQGQPLEAADIDRMLDDALTPSQRQRLESTGRVRFAMTAAGLPWIGTCQRSASSVMVALRASTCEAPTIASLGCPESVTKIVERSHGIVIVAGPSGSGRTTALAAFARHAAEARGRFVVSIEDPTEVTIAVTRGRVSQRELGTDCSASVAAAFAHAVREGAEVVCVDAELDGATLELAVDAAASGRLVLLAERARGAAEALSRSLDRLPERLSSAFGSSLAAVIALELVPSADLASGMSPAHEILLGGAALAGIVRDRRTDRVNGLLAAGQSIGMTTLELSLERLVARGAITIEAARAAALEPSRLRVPASSGDAG